MTIKANVYENEKTVFYGTLSDAACKCPPLGL